MINYIIACIPWSVKCSAFQPLKAQSIRGWKASQILRATWNAGGSFTVASLPFLASLRSFFYHLRTHTRTRDNTRTRAHALNMKKYVHKYGQFTKNTNRYIIIYDKTLKLSAKQ